MLPGSHSTQHVAEERPAVVGDGGRPVARANEAPLYRSLTHSAAAADRPAAQHLPAGGRAGRRAGRRAAMALSGAASRRPLLLLLLLSSLSGLQVGPRPSHLSHTCPGGWRTMAKRTAKMAADGGGLTDGGQDRGGRGVRDGDPTPPPPVDIPNREFRCHCREAWWPSAAADWTGAWAAAGGESTRAEEKKKKK